MYSAENPRQSCDIEVLEPTDKPFESTEIPFYVHTLGLNKESTADEVRRTAISFRQKFNSAGLSRNQVLALKWSLLKTGNAQNSSEFDIFMLFDWSFEEIIKARKS